MNRREHLLTILAEECAEVAQMVSKSLRFGLQEVRAGQSLTNEQRLRHEILDLMAVHEMLIQEGTFSTISSDAVSKAIQTKKERVEKYLLHSKACGTLD